MTKGLLVLWAALLCAGVGQWNWSFEKDEVGKKPAGFYFEQTDKEHPAKWRIIDDDEHHVLARLDRVERRHHYSLAVVKDCAIDDVKASVRVKAVEGKLDQAGGLMWRYRNRENYLVARLDITERNVRLFRFVDGNRIQFGVAEGLDVKQGQWYTLRVEHRGPEVKVYLGDEVLFIERDRHFGKPGRIGLWAKSDSVVYFDDFQAERLPPRGDAIVKNNREHAVTTENTENTEK